ncbi:MAG: hypothetical protein K6A28_03785 [Bacteroidales bacterium]|nr:hypothetical protein [Bacteroidales bacterium]
MKRKLLLLSLTAFMLVIGSTVNAQNLDVMCIGHELDGSVTLRVWAEGRNRRDAKQQVKKNAVYEVLFNGIRRSNDGKTSNPLVTEVNARDRYRDYFDAFFRDGGDYRDYVTFQDKRLGSSSKKVGRNQVRLCMTVRVLVPELKRKLIQDGILGN